MAYTGNILQFTKNPLEFLKEATKKHGDIVPLQKYKYPVYLFTHPNYIKSVLVTNNRHVKQGRAHRKLKFLLGNGLLTSDGNLHRKQRQKAQPFFHHKQIAKLTNLMYEETKQCLTNWKENISLDLLSETKKISLHIAQRAFFDSVVPIDLKSLQSSVQSVNQNVIYNSLHTHLFSTTPFKKKREGIISLQSSTDSQKKNTLFTFSKSVAFLKNTLRETLATHEKVDYKNANKNCFQRRGILSSFFDETENKLEQALTLFLASFETTSNALIWCLCLLHQHPQVLKKVQKEIQTVLGKQAITFNDIPKLHYVQNIFLEALRLYPPVWITARTVIEEFSINGHLIPKNSELLVSQYLTHRDPRWFHNPNEFQPERWDSGFQNKLPSCAYFPFGMGARQCIGEHFARLEILIVLSTILQKYELKIQINKMPTLNPQIGLSPLEKNIVMKSKKRVSFHKED